MCGHLHLLVSCFIRSRQSPRVLGTQRLRPLSTGQAGVLNGQQAKWHQTIKGKSKTEKSISSSAMEMDLMEQGEHNGFAVAS